MVTSRNMEAYHALRAEEYEKVEANPSARKVVRRQVVLEAASGTGDWASIVMLLQCELQDVFEVVIKGQGLAIEYGFAFLAKP